MKKKFTLLLAAGLFFAVASQAQGYNDHGYAYNKEIRGDRHAIAQDRNDLYKDETRISNDRHDIYTDREHGNYRDARHDRVELFRDHRDRFFDRHELRNDRRNIHFDRRVDNGCY